LDNILRALVGDISDLDAKANRIDQLSDGSWLIDGQFPFADFVLHFDVEDTSYLDHINTLGGLILSELNTIPTVGEKLVWKGLELQVFAMDNVKIKRVRVKKL
jgi:putative hemolysin